MQRKYATKNAIGCSADRAKREIIANARASAVASLCALTSNSTNGNYLSWAGIARYLFTETGNCLTGAPGATNSG
eukprot:6364727-Lingulodinium_polyedra.AAC.1